MCTYTNTPSPLSETRLVSRHIYSVLKHHCLSGDSSRLGEPGDQNIRSTPGLSGFSLVQQLCSGHQMYLQDRPQPVV